MKNYQDSSVSSVHMAAILIGSAGFISRVLGIIRDRLLAAQFGAGRELDMYLTAFQIPDFMAAIFLLGAGSVAILPVFQEYFRHRREDAQILISSLTSVFVGGASLISIIMFIAAPWLVRILTPGFALHEQDITVTLTRIMLLSPILLGLSSIFSAVIQSHERFWAFAAAPIAYNLGIIAGILFFAPRVGLPGLAAGVVMGALLHMGIQGFSLWRLGLLPRINAHPWTPGIRKVFRLSFPRVISLSLSEVTSAVLVAIGSTLAVGSITVFKLSQNLYFLPVGLFGISYSVALFPRLSMAFIKKEPDRFFNELFLGIRATLFWVLPATALYLVLRLPLVAIVLRTGSFTGQDSRLTAASLFLLALALTSGSLIPLLIKGYYAIGRTWLPLGINIISSAFTLILAYAGASLLAFPNTPWQWRTRELVASFFALGDTGSPAVLGIAAGFAAGITLNGFLLYYALMRTARRAMSGGPAFPAAETAKIAFSSVSAGVAAYAIRVSISNTLSLTSFGHVLLLMGASAGGGIAIYAGTLALLQSKDLRFFVNALRRRSISLRALFTYGNGEKIP